MPTSEKDSCCSNEIFTISDEQFEKLKLDYCPEGVEEIDQDVWTKYFKEIEESEVFMCGICDVLHCFFFCPPPPLSLLFQFDVIWGNIPFGWGFEFIIFLGLCLVVGFNPLDFSNFSAELA